MAKGHLSLANTVISLWRMMGRGFLFLTPNGKYKTPGGGWITVGTESQPDITGYELVDGIPVICFIEVKTINDSVKPGQKEFMAHRADEGCQCYVAKPNSKGQLTLRKFPYENGQKEILL